MLTIGIPKETIKGETRVALSPTISKQLTNKGFKIYLEPNAGEHCCFSDNDYIESGAEIIDLNKIYQCDLIVKINPPNKDEISMMKKGITLISLLFAHSNISTVTMLAEKQINVLSLDSIPRTSLA
jgi:NAD(P) transhydrogenase subunit alpha